ncbi:MAG: helix-turn-helix domain-containing protein [Lachnospiraceae bacterium]|nr:helix-turn-helix domain-containing protein [Lachnospiraceae bacterium]
MMSGLNERLKAARIKRKYSQEEVAVFLGVNRTAIVEIEAGRRKISADELARFSELFRITADELLNGKPVGEKDLLLLYRFHTLNEDNQQEVLDLIEFKAALQRKREEQQHSDYSEEEG